MSTNVGSLEIVTLVCPRCEMAGIEAVVPGGIEAVEVTFWCCPCGQDRGGEWKVRNRRSIPVFTRASEVLVAEVDPREARYGRGWEAVDRPHELRG